MLVSWLVALFLLFALTAYRPVLPFDGFRSLEVAWSSPEAQPDRPLAQMHNRTSAMSLREYLGRAVGAIPPACAITQGKLRRPTGSEMPGQPGILALLGYDQGEITEPYTPCLWRDDPRSILAALSFDVGPVQKFTLLILIIALFMLQRNKFFRTVEEEAWPVNDELRNSNKPGWRDKIEMVEEFDADNQPVRDENGQHKKERIEKTVRMPEVVHHPVRYIRPSNVTGTKGNPIPQHMLAQTFFPTQDLLLEPMTAEGSAVRRYEQGLSEVEKELHDAAGNQSLRGPVDLIKDVLKAGAHSGKVGDSERRMRVAVYEYTSSLSDRLDMAHYLMWLLPTVGFLGTIYGISASLVRAKGLFGGKADLDPNKFSKNIELVVDGLGVAFDTTSMALVCSAFLYWRLVRAEQDIRTLSIRARDSLSNLLVDRLVDRVIEFPPNGLGTEASAPTETGKPVEVPTSAAAAPFDPDVRGPDVQDAEPVVDDEPAAASTDGSPGASGKLEDVRSV
ncbi:MotA/TolQ/ExbB proton channel family protein [Cohaesibacter gelatinilyticus]|uniref:MotA/TolQ/ExbB proton channel family protein n=1 Tax=Cohaesibacter gelatinilyticus TaxID=372072 RepID=UPI0011435B1C|nr:MotA/TolQ/ExbB proton channel family protein [Cohaesibacter gelatinilyticus]